MGCGRRASGRVRMRLDEGLVGLVAEQLRPQVIEDAFNHPRFKYFGETGEDPYRSFLGVPLIDHGLLQGVLVVQTTGARTFPRDEVRLLVAAGAQLVADRRRRAHARAIHRAGPSTAQGARPQSMVELGRRSGEPVPRSRSPCTGGSSITTRSPCSSRCRPRSSKSGPRNWLCTAASTTPTAGMQEYLNSTKPGARGTPACCGRGRWPIFRPNSAFTNRLPIYSGGLGVLSGDHIKSASDLDIPLIGIGLFYSQGYFKQRLNVAGWQEEDYLNTAHRGLPMKPATGPDGNPVMVRIDTRTGTISARVWQLAVGRNTLYLLDSNVDGNQPEDRELTARFMAATARAHPSGAAARHRRRAGVAALGIVPGVFHLNEGHSAFAALELCAMRMQSRGHEPRRSRAPCVEASRVHHAYTGAGRARSLLGRLMEEHLGPLRECVGLTYEHLLGLGRVDPYDPNEDFCMTVLALKLSRRCNAVSSLHGEVSRSMWTAFSRAGRRRKCRSDTSPTVSTSSRGSRRKCTRCTTAILGRLADAVRRSRLSGSLSKT